MKLLPYIIIAILTGLLVACANTSSVAKDPNKYVFSDLEEVKSIRESDIDGWTMVDKKSLIVSTSPSKSYLIILKHPNNDLGFAHAISFGKSGYIYSKFDSIQIINSSSQLQPLPAYIERIYKLENKDQKKLITARIRDNESVDSLNGEGTKDAE